MIKYNLKNQCDNKKIEEVFRDSNYSIWVPGTENTTSVSSQVVETQLPSLPKWWKWKRPHKTEQ
jgi:hypothetical protein